MTGQTIYNWRNQPLIHQGLSPGVTTSESVELAAPEAHGEYTKIGGSPRSSPHGSRPLLSVPVTRRSDMLSSPCKYLAEDASWPSGDLVKDIPGEVLVVQRIAQRVWEEIDAGKDPNNKIDDYNRITVEKIADEAGVTIQTVYNFLNGDSWGTIRLLYGLERALGQQLWTGEHLTSRWDAELRRRRRS